MHDFISSSFKSVFVLRRTFVFSQGGPYYESLRNLLGAYTCYRPDVGYVSRVWQLDRTLSEYV